MALWEAAANNLCSIGVCVFVHEDADKDVGLQDHRNFNGLQDVLYSDAFYIRIKVTTDSLVIFLNRFWLYHKFSL